MWSWHGVACPPVADYGQPSIGSHTPLGRRTVRSEMTSKDKELSGRGGLFVGALIILGVAGLFFTLEAFTEGAAQLREAQTFQPEIVLTVLLLAALTGLIISLVIVAAVFRVLGLSNDESSLGLPDGSVQAFIALSLILIFAITAVYLHNQLQRGVEYTSVGLTAAELEQIPDEQIVRQVPSEEDGATFDVVRLIPPSPASQDFAQQVGTTTSTLVVAVAGFYFGSRAVRAAQRHTGGGTNGGPGLRLVTPNRLPVRLPPGAGKRLQLRLSPTPKDEPIEVDVEGDAPESVEPLDKPEGAFAYTRAKETRRPVTIRFNLANEPEKKVVVVVLAAEPASSEKIRRGGRR